VIGFDNVETLTLQTLNG